MQNSVFLRLTPDASTASPATIVHTVSNLGMLTCNSSGAGFDVSRDYRLLPRLDTKVGSRFVILVHCIIFVTRTATAVMDKDSINKDILKTIWPMESISY